MPGRRATLLAAVRELRRSRYDVAIDLQGLLKSALLARGSGASSVIGFATSYLRERLARPFYTDVYDPGCGGIYDPRETRHVVEINLGLLQPLGVSAHRAGVSDRPRRFGGRADGASSRPTAATRCSIPARSGRTSAGRRRASACSPRRCANGTV